MRMNQAQFSRYMADTREDFNDALFVRDNYDIINPMINVINSLDHDQFFTLKVVSTEVIMEFERIYDELRQYTENTKKKSQKENPYDYINLKDSDIMLLKVKFYIRKNGVDKIKIGKEEKSFNNPDDIVDVLIALPRFVNKYYFKLSGSYYSVVTQIVDGSTYNNATSLSSKVDSVTFKILFGMTVMYRRDRILQDVNTLEDVNLKFFTAIIFNNHSNVMIYLLARYGLYGAMQFFGLDSGFILITDQPVCSDNYYCFNKRDVYVSIDKRMAQYEVFSSLAVTILESVNKDTRAEDMFTYDHWIKALGQCFKNATIEKGISILDSAEYLYELQTQKELRLSDNSKADFFHILRWMICNFDALMDKDNRDVSFKRRRLGETIAHLYATRITTAIHRLCGCGRRVKLDQVRSAIRKDPMELLNQIAFNKNMTNIVAYDDLVNDDDAITALRYTYKGISGLGENGGKVQDMYRLVDPSHLGIIDLDAVKSDPGLSGLLVPTAQTFGPNNEFFSPNMEPDDWLNMIQEIREANIAEGWYYPVDFEEKPQIDFTKDYNFIRDERVQEISTYDEWVSPFIFIDEGNKEINKEKKKIASLFNGYDEGYSMIMNAPTEPDEEKGDEE